MVCPKKKKRKQCSPAKVRIPVRSDVVVLYVRFSHSDVDTCLCSLYRCRFSTRTMMDYWASRTPSVMSAFTVMLHSGPTTICKDTSSFTPVRVVVKEE